MELYFLVYSSGQGRTKDFTIGSESAYGTLAVPTWFSLLPSLVPPPDPTGLKFSDSGVRTSGHFT